MRKQDGFSPTQLLILVAIVLLSVAVAIPNSFRARIAANESSAASSIRTLNTAEVGFASTYPAHGYSVGETGLSALGPPDKTGCPVSGPAVGNACLIDWLLSQASSAATSKSGYFYAIGSASDAAPFTHYTVGGVPASFDRTGVRSFCSTSDDKFQVIHFNPSWVVAPETTNTVCAGWPKLR
jgi:type IV pilus assembly protein PilA